MKSNSVKFSGSCFDVENYILLQKAILENDSARMLQLLSKVDVDIESKYKDGCTLLHLATITNSPKIVELLLNHKANPNSKQKQDFTPLHIAAMKGKEKIVKILLNSGASVHSLGEDGKTPLHLSAMQDRQDIIEMLVKAGAKIDSQDVNGYTPLHMAASRGSVNAATYLIENHANKYMRQKNGCTPLHVAIACKQKEMVVLLLNYGIDVESCDLLNGIRPLHMVASNGDTEIAKILLDNDANIFAKDARGKNVSHLAAMEGNSDILQFFADYFKDSASASGKSKVLESSSNEHGKAPGAKAVSKLKKLPKNVGRSL